MAEPAADILARTNVPVLAQLAWSNTLLAFDHDGTLAPIAVDPDKARLRARTRALLAEVAQVYPCVVISGRSRGDALRHLRGIGVFEVLGNHGLEPWCLTEFMESQVRSWSIVLQRDLRSVAGLKVEDKRFSLAIHYRRSRAKRMARARIGTSISGLSGVRVLPGKCAVNLLPQGAPHKGLALDVARKRLGCDVALYVGDDQTDEDVFAMNDPSIVTVRVGRSTRTRASFFVRRQGDVDTLLASLIALRRGACGASAE